MEVESWPIERVKPYEGNPRRNDKAVDAVAASIREFGFRQPIVVDEQGIVIVGHTRLKAAQKLELKEVPVHVAKGLSSEQVRAYRLADNATRDLSEWDYDLLPAELGRAIEDLPELDWETIGFDSDILFQAGLPEDNEAEEEETRPLKPVCVHLSFNPDTWLVHQEEIKASLERLEKTWRCEIKVTE